MTEAIRLYLVVAQETVASNPPRSSEATQRALYLQNTYRNYGNGNGFVRAPIEPSSEQPAPPAAPDQGRVYPLATETAGAPLRPVPGELVSRSSASPPVSINSRSPAYVGRLVRSGRVVDGQRTYSLEVNNVPRLYVTAQAGVDLESFVNANVEVSGPTVYRGDLRANYLTAAQVRQVP